MVVSQVPEINFRAPASGYASDERRLAAWDCVPDNLVPCVLALRILNLKSLLIDTDPLWLDPVTTIL